MENCGLFVFNSNNDSFQLYFWQIVLNWCLLDGFFFWLNKNNNLLHLFKFNCAPLQEDNCVFNLYQTQTPGDLFTLKLRHLQNPLLIDFCTRN